MTENFSGVGTRLREKLDELHMKQIELANKADLSKNALSNYINDNRLPDTHSLYKLASILDVSMEWVLTGESKSHNRELTPEQSNLLQQVALLTPINLHKIQGMIELKLLEQQEEANFCYITRERKMPYLDEEATYYGNHVEILGSVAAGKPIEAVNTADDLMVLSGTNKADFALKIRGDSMEPQIMDGSTVLVAKQEIIETGQIGIFSINGEVTCKRAVLTEGRLELHSFNKKYNPIIIKEADREDMDVVVIGRVLLDEE